MADDAEVDADLEQDEDGNGLRKKKGLSGKALVLFILLPLLLLGGGGGGAYFAGVFDSEEEPTEEASEQDIEKKVVFYDLPEMLVNLNTKDTTASYLKLRVSLELDDETFIPDLQKLMPRVIDNFQVYIRELRKEDLRGSAGIIRLKEELLVRINTSIRPVQVKDILLHEMLVQ